MSALLAKPSKQKGCHHMDMFKKEQEAMALRQRLEETYANNPRMRDALRANADALDLELRNLPSGIDTSVAIDHLRTQSWFGDALSEPFEAIASGVQHEEGWGSAQRPAAPEETPVPDFGLAPRPLMQSNAFQPPSPTPAGWYGDNDIALFVGRGAASPAIWAQRYDPSCPSEFYRGYLSLLGWISSALRRNPTLPSLRKSIDDFDVAIKALPANECRNGASFALVNVAQYADAGTIPLILTTLDAEIVCIAHCFIQNRKRGL
jgi:hypothetical protein